MYALQAGLEGASRPAHVAALQRTAGDDKLAMFRQQATINKRLLPGVCHPMHGSSSGAVCGQDGAQLVASFPALRAARGGADALLF